MDRTIRKKKKWPLLLGIGTVALLAAGAYYFLGTRYASTLQVPADRLTVNAVTSSPFTEYISLTGRLEPTEVYYLDSRIGGVVDRLFVQPGATVERGDTLLRIANADLELEVLQRESELLEQLNAQRQTALLLNQNDFTRREQLAETDFLLALENKRYDRERSLAADSLLAPADFEPTAARYAYYQDRRRLLDAAYREDSISRRIQLAQINASEQRLTDNLRAVRRILDRLYLVAPLTGRLSDFTAKVGQAMEVGDRLGQIYRLDDFTVEAEVDEFYLGKVAIDQPGTIALRDGDVPVRVSSILPTVEDGRFRILVDFNDPERIPDDLVRGQSLRLKLRFGEPTESTLIAVGEFYASTGGNWVYVLEGDRAHRRPIRLGRQNPREYEVLEGLRPGERVITSGYEEFQDYPTLQLR
ncbi:efflux RND transporter periplasmic adaptor subunit [Lewinella sp. IMCC34191]|uniref:efflux RND transporter periplasmic adaptor subunit n=1 Tax=Lewinella sp. IMCC34191 TaxID=2259172 RepID=UPI00130021C6|nr:HlyD family efflux transporter periplasmic adaptor subunit [Lewinella sp. IMCC34191]